RRRAVRDLHARDAHGGAGLPRWGRVGGRRCHPRSHRRQPLPLHGLHEDRRRDRRRRLSARLSGRALMPAEPPIEVPSHLFEAYERLAAQPAPVPIAGGTDIMVRITGELGEVPTRMLDLSRVEALKGITLDSGGLVLGAATTYTEI